MPITRFSDDQIRSFATQPSKRFIKMLTEHDVMNSSLLKQLQSELCSRVQEFLVEVV